MNGSSLSDLRDLAIPPEPGFLPLAPGMWLLVAVLFSCLIFISWRLVGKRQANAYRRAGLLLLPGAETVYDVSVLLKRVALAVVPRREVASLHGKAWLEFLATNCPGTDLSELIEGDRLSPASPALRETAARWIKMHKLNSRAADGGAG